MEQLGIVRMANAKADDFSAEMFRLNWQMEQLLGTEKVDGLDDIKRRMKAVKKAAKNKERK